MKKILIIFLICIMGLVAIFYEYKFSIKENEQLQEENKVLTLDDFPELKMIVNDLIDRLKQTTYYDSIKFNEIKENKDKEITIKYSIDDTKLDLVYYNNSLKSIWLHYTEFDYFEFSKFDYHKYINQKLAIIYLDEFDIREEDFDNSNELCSYDNFVEVISGTSKNHYAVTTEEKSLLISYDETDHGFSFRIIK